MNTQIHNYTNTPTYALRASMGRPTYALRASVGRPTIVLGASVGRPTSALGASVGRPTSVLRAYAYAAASTNAITWPDCQGPRSGGILAMT